MGQRRFAPLIVLVLISLCVVLGRMAQVQLGEHEVWAREAANLVREGHTLPYHRGSILDRNGGVIIQDDDAYEIELLYREFRREHPLGQIAHARAALEMRDVSLHRAAQSLIEWGFELLESSPADVDRFEEGEAFELPSLFIPVGDVDAERRVGRSGELRFYARALLSLSRGELRVFRRAARKAGRERSWLELAAEAQSTDVAAVRSRLARGWQESLDSIEELAWRLGIEDQDGLPPLSRREGFVRLVEYLQGSREAIEDAIAAELFARAFEFPAARVDPLLLARAFDLEWIADCLRWAPERTELWLARLRADRELDWRSFHVEVALLRAASGDAEEPPLDRLMTELAALFAAPERRRPGHPAAERHWSKVDDLTVLSDLDSLFEGVETEALHAPLLPFQAAQLRAAHAAGAELEPLVADMVRVPVDTLDARPRPAGFKLEAEEGEAWAPPETAEESALRLSHLVEPLASPPAGSKGDRRYLATWFVAGWEEQYQRELALRLDALVEAHGGEPLLCADWRQERALETFAYAVRDHSSRPITVHKRPDYEVVYLLTRHPEALRGFRVKQTTRRTPVARDELGGPVATELIGRVRESTLEEVLEQRERRRRMFELRKQRLRSEAERDEMVELVTQIYRNDEVHGSSGIEGLYDEVLRGENGYLEREGLQEREERGGRSFQKDPVDGEDLVLTLDLGLQAAALDTLLRPELPAGEDQRDEPWFANPVGAIVMITPDGELLAAASVPREAGLPLPGRDGQAAEVVERTMRRPTFQPVGSVFKPFVAAYALEFLGLDPAMRVPCFPNPELGGAAGYGNVRCHNPVGHGPMNLAQAIQVSCNSYFARLGESLGSQEVVLDLCHTFGFDLPTGVCDSGYGRGMVEDFRMDSFLHYDGFGRRQLQQAGNGLNVIEGTPLQVARAVAAIATGELPDLRLDRPSDERPARMGTPLPVSEAMLERIRRAMVSVVLRGSASGKHLGVADLGFTLAAKTGSADYGKMNAEVAATLTTNRPTPDRRKHTWLACWFPAEDPVAICVVYLHDVGFTSSHTAVYVAGQFLRTDEVRRFVQEERR